jgi:hypothetical protein
MGGGLFLIFGALPRLGLPPDEIGAQGFSLPLLPCRGSALTHRAQLRLFGGFLGHGTRVAARDESVKVAKQAWLVYLRAAGAAVAQW